MFDCISKLIRSIVIDDDYICNLIHKTVRENLETNWKVEIVDKFDYVNLLYLMSTRDESRNDVVVVTSYYEGKEIIENGSNGVMQFNLTNIKKCISNLGYRDAINNIVGVTLREVRCCQQYDFLREAGGDELTNRVLDNEDMKPLDENILEVDAKAFQLYGIKFDFKEIFASYLESKDESGDPSERFIRNSWSQSKYD